MIDQTPRQLGDADDEWMTVEEVADYLKVTPAWVRAHSNGNRQPTLPSAKFGKHRRFRRAAIREYSLALEAASSANALSVAG
jgi:excisionase family DNA binding protein